LIPDAKAEANTRSGESLVLPTDYRLVWSDEFDRSGPPDPARWDYDTEFNRTGWHNRERQYYSAHRIENARVENGRLTIEARAERLKRERDWGGQRYSSARLVTRGRAAWTYGYFEVRAKLPCTRGTWPAIWLLPATRTPDFIHGEIDVMEHVGHEPGRVRHSVHTGSHNHARGNHRTATSRVGTACDAFHTYQLLWTANRITIGVDGHISFEHHRRPGADWPFDEPFYLILNLAVGGILGEVHGINDTALPSRMEVEAVRVYQFSPDSPRHLIVDPSHEEDGK
jgi:beta-glucanase (GH16 family)